MFIRILYVLLLVFFSSEMTANPAVFTPDFSRTPILIPSGTTLLPLCNNPMDPLCMSQWSQQAVPLAVFPEGIGFNPQFQYFMPAFIADKIIGKNPKGDKDWEVWAPSFSSSFRRKEKYKRSVKTEADANKKKDQTIPSRVFYRNKSKPNEVRIVDTDEQGNRTIRARRGHFSEKDINQSQIITKNPEGDKDWEIWTPSFQSVKPVSDKVQPAGSEQGDSTKASTDVQSSSISEKNNTKTEIKVQHPNEDSSTSKGKSIKTENVATSVPNRVFYRKKSNPDEIRVVSTNEQGHQTIQTGRVEFVSANDIQKAETGDYKTNEDTYTLPATIKEVQPGCFIIDKSKETEAGFCFECKRENGEEDSVLSSLLGDKNFIASLMNYLKKVRYNTNRKVSSQTVVSGDSIQKICSPEVSLKAIIHNFNKTCPQPYKNNFKAFFKTAYCESCKKGIPPEIMMAMMSIESAGRCPADSKMIVSIAPVYFKSMPKFTNVVIPKEMLIKKTLQPIFNALKIRSTV